MTIGRDPAMFSKILGIAGALTLACGLAAAESTTPQPPPVTGTAPAAKAVSPSPKNATGADIPSGGTIRSVVDEVNVIFTVTDKHGKFVRDLKQSQFKILDNNLPPKQIKSFEAETDLPLRVGLLIDASNSIRDRFLFEQQAAVAFLHQTIRPKTDRAFVLAFDEVWDVTQDFTNDLDKLTKGVTVIRPGGGTAVVPCKLQNLADDFNDIQAELRSQYSISYKPDQFEANGQFRAIQIIPDDKKLKIRAKKGYYVPR